MPFEERLDLDGGRKFRLKVYAVLAVCLVLALVVKFALGSGRSGRVSRGKAEQPLFARFGPGESPAAAVAAKPRRNIGLYGVPQTLSPISTSIQTSEDPPAEEQGAAPPRLARRPASADADAGAAASDGTWPGGVPAGRVRGGGSSAVADGQGVASGGSSTAGKASSSGGGRDAAGKTARDVPPGSDPSGGAGDDDDDDATGGDDDDDDGAGDDDDDDDDDGTVYVAYGQDDPPTDGPNAPAGTESVPEPATVLLLAGGAVLLVRRRLRR